MTQITQMKTRTFCDDICVNLRDLRESPKAFQQESLCGGGMTYQLAASSGG